MLLHKHKINFQIIPLSVARIEEDGDLKITNARRESRKSKKLDIYDSMEKFIRNRIL